MIKGKENKQLGQTLLEALIALGTAVVIISAMSVLVLSSLNNAQFSKNQNQATQYAQQGIEVLKNLAQSNWASFSILSGHYCLPQDNVLVPSATCSLPNLGSFGREVDITLDSASCAPRTSLVTVTVSWSDNKCTSAIDPYCHKIPIISCIYNTTTVTTP